MAIRHLLAITFLFTLAVKLEAAPTFTTGLVDVDRSQTSAFAAIEEVNRLNLGGGGVSYTNLNTADGTITAVGYVLIPTASVGAADTTLGDVLAVYALEGTSGGSSDLSAQFTSGQLRVYDIQSLAGGFRNDGDPSTWIPESGDAVGFDAADLNNTASLLATFNLGVAPGAIEPGGPFPTFDQAPLFDPEFVNTANADLDTLPSLGTAQAIFDYVEGSGTYFDFSEPGYLLDPDAQMLVQLNQILAVAPLFDMDALNTIYSTFLGGGAFGSLNPLDDDFYDPTNPALTGDAFQDNDGGLAIPGSSSAIPEPSSILLWVLASGGCAVFGYRRFRKRAKAA